MKRELPSLEFDLPSKRAMSLSTLLEESTNSQGPHDLETQSQRFKSIEQHNGKS
jgi:hypothetical protein